MIAVANLQLVHYRFIELIWFAGLERLTAKRKVAGSILAIGTNTQGL